MNSVFVAASSRKKIVTRIFISFLALVVPECKSYVAFVSFLFFYTSFSSSVSHIIFSASGILPPAEGIKKEQVGSIFMLTMFFSILLLSLVFLLHSQKRKKGRVNDFIIGKWFCWNPSLWFEFFLFYFNFLCEWARGASGTIFTSRRQSSLWVVILGLCLLTLEKGGSFRKSSRAVVVRAVRFFK